MPVLEGFASWWGTQKYADFLDACVAITGRAPLAGCHLERAAQVVLKVKMDVSSSPARRFSAWKQWLAYLVMDISIFQSFCIHSPYHNQKTEPYNQSFNCWFSFLSVFFVALRPFFSGKKTPSRLHWWCILPNSWLLVRPQISTFHPCRCWFRDPKANTWWSKSLQCSLWH